MKQIYLTDGVYATINKDDIYPVILTTGNHIIEKADAVIYLEWSAYSMLITACREEGVVNRRNDIGGNNEC
jgi:hypothetical protein